MLASLTPAATFSVARTRPLTWTGISTSLSFASSSCSSRQDGPRCVPEAVRVAEHFPHLLGYVRGHGCESRAGFAGPPCESRASHRFRAARPINLVGQFHDLGNRRIEVPAGLEVLRNSLHCLIGDSDQVTFFVGYSLRVEIPVLGLANCSRVLIHQAKHTIKKAPRAFDAFLVPLEVFFGRGGKERVEAAGIGASFRPCRWRRRHCLATWTW